MKFRFGLWAILLLFIVGVVSTVTDYHTYESNGDKEMTAGADAVQKKNNSLGLARTAQRAASNAKSGDERQTHQETADGHTRDANTHRADAHRHYSEAAGHYKKAKEGREALRDGKHGGKDDAGHEKALKIVGKKLGNAKNFAGQNEQKPKQRRRR